jgi:hypothetical protein
LNDTKPRALPALAPGSFRATLMPKGIGWTASVSAGAGTTGRYRIVVWRFNPQWGAWYVLPLASYQPDGATVWRNGDTVQDIRLVLRESDYGECLAMHTPSPFITNTTPMVPSDQYRVDLYNGATRVAGVPLSAGEEEHRPFDAAAFRDVGIRLCYPHAEPAWTRMSNHDGSLGGGYRSQDRTRGAYLFAIVAPRFGVHQADVERRQLKKAVSLTLHSIGADDLHSGRYVVDEQPRCGDLWDRWGSPHAMFSGRAASAIAKAWTEPDGLIHVGVVWRKSAGPANDRLGCEILTSMTSVDPDPR